VPESSIPHDRRPFAIGLGAGLLTWIAVAAIFAALGFEVVQSDVAEYARWSHDPTHVVSITHIPGYPMLVWLLRQLTLGLFGDPILFQGTALLGWAVAMFAVDRILAEQAPEGRALGLLAYGMWPFVGICYTAFPVSDSTAGAVLALGAWAMTKRRWGWFALAMGFGLLIHKALWPTWGLLALVALFRYRAPIGLLVAAALPILAWFGWGYRSRSGLWWLEDHVDEHLTYRSGLPVLDGLLGPLLLGSYAKYAKMLVTWGALAVAAALTVWSARRREWWLAAIAFPTVFWMLILNEWVIWAAVRHEKLVAVPLAIWWVSEPSRARIANDSRFVGLLAAGLAATQLVFAWYMVRGFFPQ
jgi:hypothetical protein